MSAGRSRSGLGPGMRFFFGRIFPMIFVLVGAGVLVGGVRNLLIARDSVNWPKADGVVVSSDVERHRSDDGTSYSAEVYYEYDVDGEKRASNRVTVGSVNSSNPASAREVVNRYPAGKVVSVAYNPQDPGYGLLETGVTWSTWFLPLFGGVFFAVGSIMAVFLPRSFRQKSNRNRGRGDDSGQGGSGEGTMDYNQPSGLPSKKHPTDFTVPGGR